MRSRALLTAVELDVFTSIGGDAATAPEVAARIGTHEGATEMLLNALVALGLLTKANGRFRCGQVARQHLSSDSPEDRRSSFMHLGNLWETWSTLTACVRSGTCGSNRVEHTTRDEAWTRAFIGAMHDFALSQADTFVDAIDLTGTRNVLDLGGGSGAYAISFARRDPEIRVTVFDLPTVVPLTRDYVSAAGVAEQVDVLAGDMCTDELGQGYDLVWVSSICHMLGPADNKALFRKARRALNPGGRMAVRDFILDDDKTAPPFGAVFALNMLVNTTSGSSYSRAEYCAWLAEAGFSSPELVEVAGAGSAAVLVARARP